MRTIKQLIVHCSDTPPDMDIGVDEIRDWHVEEKGWIDVGYHHVIRRDGTLEGGRPLAQAGAHARGYNLSSIGICLVGGGGGLFNFTLAQINCLAKLLDYYREKYPEAEAMGHRDLPGVFKTCPCFDVRSLVDGKYNQ